MSGVHIACASDSDGATIARSLADPVAFGAIFDRHYSAVYRYLARRAPRHADDLASSTFVVAFERRRTFRVKSASARPWLLGIATNLLHERARRERRELTTVLTLGAQRFVNDRADTGFEDGQRLSTALADLSESQRDVLLLYAWEELSYEEISDALGVPLGTVRSRLARARAHLKAALEESHSNSEPSPIHARSTDA